MAMNRRNVLIGLGAVAAGGGALLGTGAFSTVEAERTVSLSAADDNNANVELSVDETSNAITDSGSNTINIDGENLNYDAITTVNGALTITVSSNATGDYEVDLLDSIGGSSVSKGSANRSSGDDDMQFVSNAGASDSVTDGGSGGFSAVSPGESVKYDVTFNLLGDTESSDVTVPFSGDTVVVEVK